MIPQRPLEQTVEFTIFLSSGSDVHEVRDRLDDLIRAASTTILHTQKRLRLAVRRWEDVVPTRAAAGHKTNDIFVEEATNSHLTIAILQCEIRPGTREELEAVLSQTSVNLAVFRFTPPEGCDHPDTELLEFLACHQDDFLYKDLGHYNDPASWRAILELIISIIAGFLPDSPEAYQRDRL